MLNNIHDNDQDYLYMIDISTSRQFEHEHHKNPVLSNKKKNLETQIKTHKVNISPILIASKKGSYALELT